MTCHGVVDTRRAEFISTSCPQSSHAITAPAGAGQGLTPDLNPVLVWERRLVRMAGTGALVMQVLENRGQLVPEMWLIKVRDWLYKHFVFSEEMGACCSQRCGSTRGVACQEVSLVAHGFRHGIRVTNKISKHGAHEGRQTHPRPYSHIVWHALHHAMHHTIAPRVQINVTAGYIEWPDEPLPQDSPAAPAKHPCYPRLFHSSVMLTRRVRMNDMVALDVRYLALHSGLVLHRQPNATAVLVGETSSSDVTAFVRACLWWGGALQGERCVCARRACITRAPSLVCAHALQVYASGETCLYDLTLLQWLSPPDYTADITPRVSSGPVTYSPSTLVFSFGLSSSSLCWATAMQLERACRRCKGHVYSREHAMV